MKPDEIFARILCDHGIKVSNEVQAIGHMMKHWLESEITDCGEKVDTGAGFGEFDLWVPFGGKELFITIRYSNAELARAGDSNG